MLFLGLAIRTIVYVDALNLYYGALKGTSYKWLDLQELFAKVLPSQYDIQGIRYFTTQVSGTPSDPSKPLRQGSYIRALQHVSPNLKVYYGHFLRHRVTLPLETPIGNQRTARVIRTEEKGSDVNLATHLLNDCWLNAYDCAAVVTNDSDIAEAMRLVKQHSNKEIGLVSTKIGPVKGRRRVSKELRQHADFLRHIRPSVLSQCQLPNPIPGTNIHKPPQR